MEHAVELPVLPENWSKHKPGAVSANLSRMRIAAGFHTRTSLAEAAGVSLNLIRRFEGETEPPANHPLLRKIAEAIARKSKRATVSVIEEMKLGGTEYEIPSKIERLMTNQKRSPRTKMAPPAKKAHTDKQVKLHIARELPPAQDARAVAQKARRVKEAASKHGKRQTRVQKDLEAILNDPIRLVRTMVTTYNQQAMNGEAFITLPLTHLRPLLETYLYEHDIRDDVLLPDFEEIFP